MVLSVNLVFPDSGLKSSEVGESPLPPQTLQISAQDLQTTHQHVLCQPPFLLGQPAGDAQRKAFLPKQRVPSISASIGDDLSAVRKVGDQCQLGVAGPIVDQRL